MAYGFKLVMVSMSVTSIQNPLGANMTNES
jgi:hypothetical protein